MASRDKIYIENDAEVERLYSRLTEERGDSPTKPFRYDRDVFLAAAIMGFRYNSFAELQKRKEKFTWVTLINDEDALPVLQTIALHRTKDPSVLLDDDAVATIAEGYANGGIRLLARRLVDTGIDELQEAAVFLAELTEG